MPSLSVERSDRLYLSLMSIVFCSSLIETLSLCRTDETCDDRFHLHSTLSVFIRLSIVGRVEPSDLSFDRLFHGCLVLP